MKIVERIAIACLFLAVFRSFIYAAVAAGAVVLLWGALFRTRATFSLLLMILIYYGFATHPVAFIIIAGSALAVVKLGRRPGNDGTRRPPP